MSPGEFCQANTASQRWATELNKLERFDCCERICLSPSVVDSFHGNGHTTKSGQYGGSVLCLFGAEFARGPIAGRLKMGLVPATRCAQSCRSGKALPRPPEVWGGSKGHGNVGRAVDERAMLGVNKYQVGKARALLSPAPDFSAWVQTVAQSWL